MATITPVRPARHATFESKRDRKARRKSLVAAALGAAGAVGSVADHVANAPHDLRLAARERMEFYRKLRMMKIHRRQIARAMALLAQMVSGLVGDVARVGDRVPGLDSRYVTEAIVLSKKASASVQAAAEEWHAFSRAKIYYRKIEGIS